MCGWAKAVARRRAKRDFTDHTASGTGVGKIGASKIEKVKRVSARHAIHSRNERRTLACGHELLLGNTRSTFAFTRRASHHAWDASRGLHGKNYVLGLLREPNEFGFGFAGTSGSRTFDFVAKESSM